MPGAIIELRQSVASVQSSNPIRGGGGGGGSVDKGVKLLRDDDHPEAGVITRKQPSSHLHARAGFRVSMQQPGKTTFFTHANAKGSRVLSNLHAEAQGSLHANVHVALA